MKFELKMRLLLVMNVNCEIYISKHIYIDLNDCYSNGFSYILMYACSCIFTTSEIIVSK